MSLQYEPYISANLLMPSHQGKVRETYQSTELGCLAAVATDRVSTHNVVHRSIIPLKGEVLTMMTVFWLTEVLFELPNHLVTWGRGIYKYLPEGIEDVYPDLHYRTLIVQNLNMVPVEFIFRRYLTGSLLKAYNKGEDPYGISLPPGLMEMFRFHKIKFTPTEKSATDDPMIAEEVLNQYSDLSKITHLAFETVEDYLAEKGITLIDSKLEAGLKQTGPCLADEVFTPDSSRFCWTKDVKEGVPPPWLDKQIVRDYAEQYWVGGPKMPLMLPPDIVRKTTQVYEELLYQVTGRTLQEWRNGLNQYQ